ECASSFLRQSNATVRCWIVRHNSGMHSEVETTQAHEVRHLDVVEGGPMISFLVRDYEVAGFRRVTLTPSRTLRAIYRHAVLKESNPLQVEGNFHLKLVW